MSNIKLGCIADDFTGATDLANNLVRAGMRVLQTIGVPKAQIDTDVDAVVIALKSRTIAAEEAVALSLAAAAWLKRAGATQIYFKYCSTFDSTPKGNIGPVTDALMQALGTDFTISTPAFPDNGRTVFKGHLFVGEVLLSESGMRDHPLTPMTDANLVRVLQAQSQHKVALIEARTVQGGSEAVTERMAGLRSEGVGIAIVDAISNSDLLKLGPALRDLPLVCGGSGVAIGLPQNFGITASTQANVLPQASGARAIVSGSCSQATNRQVAHFIAVGGSAHAVDAMRATTDSAGVVAQALDWAKARLASNSNDPLLIYSTNEPQAVRQIQMSLGVDQAGAEIERTLASIASGLVNLGVRQLIVAGGETSGACVQALGVDQLRIGPQVDTGVPWCFADRSTEPLHLALKSGNFGSDDFFHKAFTMLQ
jgi:3-dehydrotetronate 4-kinase